jgi:hypothetical protein
VGQAHPGARYQGRRLRRALLASHHITSKENSAGHQRSCIACSRGLASINSETQHEYHPSFGPHGRRFARGRRVLGPSTAQQTHHSGRSLRSRGQRRHRGALDCAAVCQAAGTERDRGQPRRWGGAIGTALVSKAPADGATLLAATPGQLGTLPRMFKTSYKSEDFVPIGVLSKTSIAVVVRNGDARFKTLEEFIAYTRANPGKLNVGHAGPWIAQPPGHAAVRERCELPLHAGRLQGLRSRVDRSAGGTIDVMFDQISSSLPHLKAGTLTTLVVLGPTRDVAVPDTRSLKEAGLPEFDASTYIGLLAPKRSRGLRCCSLSPPRHKRSPATRRSTSD